MLQAHPSSSATVRFETRWSLGWSQRRPVITAAAAAGVSTRDQQRATNELHCLASGKGRDVPPAYQRITTRCGQAGPNGVVSVCCGWRNEMNIGHLSFGCLVALHPPVSIAVSRRRPFLTRDHLWATNSRKQYYRIQPGAR